MPKGVVKDGVPLELMVIRAAVIWGLFTQGRGMPVAGEIRVQAIYMRCKAGRAMLAVSWSGRMRSQKVAVGGGTCYE